LENAEIYDIEDDLVDQIFDVAVRDFSRFAVELHGKPATTPEQGKHCLAMIRKPAADDARFQRIWQDHVYAERDAYEMPE
jgi:acyl-CoA dehydrogenase